MKGVNPATQPWQKHQMLQVYSQRFRPRVFIETGTFKGDTIKAMLPYADRLFTIDMNAVLAARASKRFAFTGKKVTCLEGDSAVVLPQVLAGITEPCLFWLDAHRAGGRHDHWISDAAILPELDCILQHSYAHEHVLLIDDTWMFTMERYRGKIAQLDQIVDVIRKRFPDWTVDIDLEIIRAHRPLPLNE